MHEIGSIVEGKVTGITKFGAFIELSDGAVGMVHISEVAATYVNDIAEHLKMNDTVKVKVLSISDEGKISLSIKKALPPAPRDNNFRQNNSRPSGGFNGGNRRPGGAPSGGGHSPSFNRAPAPPKGPASFEDMLSKFMSSSEDKFGDMKKPVSRRGSNYKKHVKDYD